MRKVFAVIFAAVFLFNTVIFAEETVQSIETDVMAVFSADPEFGSSSVTIKLSDISSGGDLSFSSNPETGFIYAFDDKYRIFIKELDDNIRLAEEALVLDSSKGIDLSLPYSFKAFLYICRQEAVSDSYISALDPQLFFSGKEAVALLSEVTLEFIDGKAQFVVRKTGTSIKSIDNGNIDDILENNMLLINKNNTLDRSYTPPDLVYSKPSRGRAVVNVRMNKDAIKQLNYMLDAAYRDGISGMVITSAFRTYDKQTSLYNNKTSTLSRKMSRKTAMEEASKVVAAPGSSEHQTGLAADICSEGVGLISNFGNTKQGKWLENNSWKFGYTIRYPKDKTGITGIIYEPWHVRYVGSVHSEIMKLNKMCLEEYVEFIKKNEVISFTDSNGSSYAIQYIYKPDFAEDGMSFNLPETSTWSISNCTKDSYILTIKL